MGPIGKITVNVWVLNGRNITERLVLNVIDHSRSYIKLEISGLAEIASFLVCVNMATRKKHNIFHVFAPEHDFF